MTGSVAPVTRRFVHITAERRWNGIVSDEEAARQVRDLLIGHGFTVVSTEVFDPDEPCDCKGELHAVCLERNAPTDLSPGAAADEPGERE